MSQAQQEVPSYLHEQKNSVDSITVTNNQSASQTMIHDAVEQPRWANRQDKKKNQMNQTLQANINKNKFNGSD